MPEETPIETLDYYARILSMIMRKPMDDGARRAVARHVERVLPDTALNELRSEWGMKLALTVTSEVLASPHVPAAGHHRMTRPARDPA